MVFIEKFSVCKSGHRFSGRYCTYVTQAIGTGLPEWRCTVALMTSMLGTACAAGNIPVEPTIIVN